VFYAGKAWPEHEMRQTFDPRVLVPDARWDSSIVAETSFKGNLLALPGQEILTCQIRTSSVVEYRNLVIGV
jgi:hypothetical protein